MKRAIGNAFQPNNAKRAKVVVPPPPPAHRSVCVMDVGQGNCNLIIDNANEPRFYYDAGFPLWFYKNSAPQNLWAGAAPPPAGPITQNTAGTLHVILSHWDWDHWRLGHVWPALQNLMWTVPVQPFGPSATNFYNALNALGNVQVVPWLAPRTQPNGNYTLYLSRPQPGMPAAAAMNNTGLALGIQTQLPFAALPNTYQVVITGDANFDSLPPPFPAQLAPNITGITAVHHGSAAHGADQNLPAPTAPYAAAGRIAYSCGINAGTGYRPYGFPNPGAIANYQAANWNAPHEMDTPEGAAIRSPAPWVRGNIQMGNPAALPGAYNYSAFFTFVHQLV